jgi:hypothetical protein
MYIRYIVACSHNHCCHGKATKYSLFTVAGIDVAVNNIQVFSVVMERQQRVPFALLSSFKIFHSAVNNFFFFLWLDSPIWAWASSFRRGFMITHIWDTPQSVGLLWTRDQFVTETSTWQHTTLTRDRHPCPPVGFEPMILVSERPKTHALDRMATGIGLLAIISIKYYEHVSVLLP